MKQQTADLLAAAEKSLAQAHGVQGISYPDQAARLAYYAMFHSAQALIFERTDQISKTHKGVRSLFHKVALSEAAINPELSRDLTNTYRFKQAADYETGSAATVTTQEGANAIGKAETFVTIIRNLLSTQPDGQTP